MFNKTIIALLLVCTVFASCKKDGFTPMSDVKPDIPVTVTNASLYRAQPTIQVSKAAGGTITITMQVPSSSGRTIKEITKVAASTTYTAVQTATAVGTGSTQLYIQGPIAGNNSNQITFTTSIADYMTRTATTTIPASNAELARQFYFMLTLDNGQVIIPEFVRVFIVD